MSDKTEEEQLASLKDFQDGLRPYMYNTFRKMCGVPVDQFKQKFGVDLKDFSDELFKVVYEIT